MEGNWFRFGSKYVAMGEAFFYEQESRWVGDGGSKSILVQEGHYGNRNAHHCVFRSERNGRTVLAEANVNFCLGKCEPFSFPYASPWVQC